MLKFDEIYSAFEYASFSGDMDGAAYLSIEKSEIVMIPDEVVAEQGEIEAAYRKIKKGKWLEIPNKKELGLGSRLVFNFAAENLSGPDQDKVDRMFARSGAYARWKSFLIEHELLQRWYDYSNAAEIKALKDWLELQEIPYEDESPDPGSE